MTNQPDVSPENKSLKQKTLSGSIWVISGMVAQIVLRLGVVAILARQLLPADFGLIAIAIVLISFGETLALRGLSSAMIPLKSLTSSHMTGALLLLQGLALTLFFLVNFSAPYFEDMTGAEGLSSLILPLSATFFLHAWAQPWQRYLQREMRFKELSIIELISYLIGYGVIGVTASILDFGVWSLVFAYLSQSLSLAIMVTARTFRLISFSTNIKSIREIAHMGLGFTLAQAIDFIGGNADRFVMVKLYGVTALGLYGRSRDLIQQFSNISDRAITRVIFPALAKIQNQTDRQSKAYLQGLTIISVIALPAVIALVLLADDIILILLGPNWVAAIVPLQALAVFLFLNTGSRLANATIASTGRSYLLSGLIFLNSGVQILLIYLFKDLGVVGVCGAVILAAFSQFCVLHVAIVILLKIRPFSLILPIVSGVPIAGFVAVIIIVLKTIFPQNWSSFVTFPIACSVAAVAVATLIYLAPNMAMGPNGQTFISQYIQPFLIKIRRPGGFYKKED